MQSPWVLLVSILVFAIVVLICIQLFENFINLLNRLFCRRSDALHRQSSSPKVELTKSDTGTARDTSELPNKEEGKYEEKKFDKMFKSLMFRRAKDVEQTPSLPTKDLLIKTVPKKRQQAFIDSQSLTLGANQTSKTQSGLLNWPKSGASQKPTTFSNVMNEKSEYSVIDMDLTSAPDRKSVV